MSDNLTWHHGGVNRSDRNTIAAGGTVWLTGLSGSGKSTLATACETALISGGRLAYTLDGDNVRHGLNVDLGFGPVDRVENVRRVGEVALLMADAGIVVLAPLISPYAAGRELIREKHHKAGLPFFEIHIATPIAVCEQRDTKGLYAKARMGEIPEFTGITAPYEEPEHPHLRIDTSITPLNESVAAILNLVAIRLD